MHANKDNEFYKPSCNFMINFTHLVLAHSILTKKTFHKWGKCESKRRSPSDFSTNLSSNIYFYFFLDFTIFFFLTMRYVKLCVWYAFVARSHWRCWYHTKIKHRQMLRSPIHMHIALLLLTIAPPPPFFLIFLFT